MLYLHNMFDDAVSAICTTLYNFYIQRTVNHTHCSLGDVYGLLIEKIHIIGLFLSTLNKINTYSMTGRTRKNKYAISWYGKTKLH